MIHIYDPYYHPCHILDIPWSIAKNDKLSTYIARPIQYTFSTFSVSKSGSLRDDPACRQRNPYDIDTLYRYVIICCHMLSTEYILIWASFYTKCLPYMGIWQTLNSRNSAGYLCLAMLMSVCISTKLVFPSARLAYLLVCQLIKSFSHV